MITTTDMKVLETNSVALGIPLNNLMEAAGKSIADFVDSQLKGKRGLRIVVMVGKGGNGGDGLVAARYLSSIGYMVEVLPAYPSSEVEHPDALFNLKILKKLDSVKIHEPGRLDVLENKDVIIDALLGTGVRGVLKSPLKELVDKANEVEAILKIAVDTPSGLNPDTGEVHGTAFKAHYTVTFHDLKPGLLKNREYTGEIIVANIGIPSEAEKYVGPGDVIHRVPHRPRDAHKGSSGRVLVIAGSKRYVGAAYLAAHASLLAGVDLSFLVVPEAIRGIAAGFSPDVITLSYPGDYLSADAVSLITKYVEELKPHAIAIGPGLGSELETLEAVKKLTGYIVEKKIPLVLDADALKTVKLGVDRFNGMVVLTPHRGEFRNITNYTITENLGEALQLVETAAKNLNAVVLLKAPVDIISNGEKTRLNRTGNPYMAVGGTGDVLTGLVTGLIPQVKNVFHAACIAAYLNGLAGDYLLKTNKHVSASNILKVLPLVKSKPLEIHRKVYD
jgi:NAD(P)H-hydrate epimerase